jgi:MFS family permease
MVNFGGKLLDKKGHKLPISLGLAIVLFGMIWLAITAQYQNYAFAVVGFIAYGIGAPLIISPPIAFVLGSVAPEMRGIAAEMLNTTRQLGATLCFAVVFSPVCPDYSIEPTGNPLCPYRHTFNELGSGLGLIAQSLIQALLCIARYHFFSNTNSTQTRFGYVRIVVMVLRVQNCEDK